MMGRPHKQIVNGPAVRDALVTAHVDLPRRVVHCLWGRYAGVRRLGWDEAEGEAWWGLLRAAGLFVASSGGFRSYAFRWCRGTVLQAAKRLRQVRTATSAFEHDVPAREEWAATVEERFANLRVLVAGLPPCPERTYLEHRMAGATQYTAWAAAGKKYRDCHTLHRKSIQLARCVAQSLVAKEHEPVEDLSLNNSLEMVRDHCNRQRMLEPDYSKWDQASLDRMWLLAEVTRLRGAAGQQRYHARRRALQPGRNGTLVDPMPIEPAMGMTGDFCDQCGHAAMIRTGNCSVCSVCGTSGGCS